MSAHDSQNISCWVMATATAYHKCFPCFLQWDKFFCLCLCNLISHTTSPENASDRPSRGKNGRELHKMAKPFEFQKFKLIHLTTAYVLMYMTHNSLGHEQPSGLDVKQSPNAQDAFQPIPGLISCAGVTVSVGITCTYNHRWQTLGFHSVGITLPAQLNEKH